MSLGRRFLLSRLVAYFQPVGGASGDMLLGAMVDAGLSLKVLEEAASALGLKGISIKAEPGRRGAVGGTLLTVDHMRAGEGAYSWEGFSQVLRKSSLPDSVKESSEGILRRLARAEARAHGRGRAGGRLHELGSLDTLVDIAGTVMGLEALGVAKVYSAPLPVGRGLVKSGHGVLPVPAPATLELIKEAEASLASSEGDASGEMVTPTGAAILTTLAEFQRPALRLEKVGHGLGAREWKEIPNVLTLWLGEELEERATATLVLLETNIDDMSPQLFGYVQERLFALGALDVWFTAIQMKKNRPGVLLSALVPTYLEGEMVELILRETSTLGIRARPVVRHEAQRETVMVKTALGEVPVKVKRKEGRVVGVAPEYEACRTIALSRRIPLQEVLGIARREARQNLMGG